MVRYFLILAALAASAGKAVAGAPTGASNAVQAARATEIPGCTLFVDAAAARSGDGSLAKPFKTIGTAISAAEGGAVICVAEGTYPEKLVPGEKYFSLAGGFQRGSEFKVRDSARFVSKAEGKGGTFLRFEDPAPKGDQLVVVDGFEISGYQQAIVREFYESQRFDITNNFIHDNVCKDNNLVGAGFAVNNVSGTISGNVIVRNSCGRGGAGFVNDSTNSNTVLISKNLIEANSGIEPESAHGGALYLFGNKLTVIDNEFVNNTVSQWGGGLYIGAFKQGGQTTTARVSRNVYKGNRAGNKGGGFFCDDGAECHSDHDYFEKNCGHNILLDSGPPGSGPTITTFDYMTNVDALEVDCGSPGIGVLVNRDDSGAADTYTITNSTFRGNGEGKDLATGCNSGCDAVKITVSNSTVQRKFADGGIKVKFEGASAPAPEKEAKAEEKPASKVAPRETTPPPVAKKTTVVAAKKPAANESEVSAEEAFNIARELGTADAWKAFLETHPTGFYANMARAYLKKLGVSEDAPASAEPAEPEPEASAHEEKKAKPDSPKAATSEEGPEPAKNPIRPAIARGGKYMGFSERFNRYYTDPTWKPSKTVFVSPDGSGDGTSRSAPMSAADAVAAAQPGTRINFLRGKYEGCLAFSKDNSGTYDEPVVLAGERNGDQSIGVTMTCCNTGRKTCINLEAADYVAVDGFEFKGGDYGVRSVGGGFAASEHARGIAVLGSVGGDQNRDPFFSGQSDWAVWERNVGYGAKKDDGHGFYISNGSDFNIVRANETYGGVSSDFQINADPAYACVEQGIPADDPRCDAYAGTGEGGQGASDFFLVENNYFHHSNGPGSNFASVRKSIIRNNIFGPQARHNVSFYQETENAKLGSSDNQIIHNLFITNARHAVQFSKNSTRNEFANNVLLGIQIKGDAATANPSAVLMEVDDTVVDNVYRGNFYASGKLEGRSPGDEETVTGEFSADWFEKFPIELNHEPNDLRPTSEAPFVGKGTLIRNAPKDRNGQVRSGDVDLGPIEIP